ncbi:threonine synthase [Neomegalonema sp.]|uniref:threonine synthase n=1 Tax=Neomegalonema sp. TaxID=2039713 RepID=UPI00261DA982|nr:threonine synthase [Neomegalonema sp.]MDD2867234.1 threonine synthase [Neomegalonema sp.]
MRYVSTRGAAPVLPFEEAMLTGLARDGGLYVPESWPGFSQADLESFADLGYVETAARVLRPFMGEAFPDAELLPLLEAAYGRFDSKLVAPLVQIGPNDWLMELFRGPTLAFKDVAMQLIGQLFDAALQRRNARMAIVGATSGDTGAAAIEAFRGRGNVDVFILYPHGRVSEVQRRQMTTPTEANVHALAVEGDFDDCQALLKAMFNDFEFRDSLNLGAVNSINWMRVLAQSVYYVRALAALGARPGREIDFSVPTGNFGDIFAGWAVRRMGLPVGRLVVAANANDILDRTLKTGTYRRAAATLPTSSPSMDIQISSNFERLVFELLDRDGAATSGLMQDLSAKGEFVLPPRALERLRAEFDSASADEAETRAVIARIRREAGFLVDPHSAVGISAATRVRGDSRRPMVALATAHPAKFPEAVEAATGERPALPPHLADLHARPERVTRLPNDLAAVQAHIRGKARA